MNLKKIFCCFSFLALIVGLIACGNDTSETKLPEQAGTQSQMPAQTLANPDAQPAAYSGKVAETQDVSPYTYVRLVDGTGKEIWAAVPQTQLKIGEEIALQDGIVMTNFSSKTLNRTFESIVFAAGFVRGSENDAGRTAAGAGAGSAGAGQSEGSPQGMTSQSGGGSSRAIASFAGVKVEKSAAKNGYTVAELFDKAADLNNRKVTVKGMVVKISPNIMGKNWIHIQDGTGDPAKNTHDLVVTSQALAEKGSIVSLEGVLAADKDFGFGYKYDVLIEDAVVVE
jgi:hypothetical protein